MVRLSRLSRLMVGGGLHGGGGGAESVESTLRDERHVGSMARKRRRRRSDMIGCESTFNDPKFPPSLFFALAAPLGGSGELGPMKTLRGSVLSSAPYITRTYYQ